MACCILPAVLYAVPARALDAAGLSDGDMMTLSKLYVEKIGRRARETDLLLDGRTSALKLAELRASARILDGEPLLMQGTAGTANLVLEGVVTAVRQNDRLMMSLAEFCATAEFPITASASAPTAAGWFFREDRAFFLDAGKRTATVAGVTSDLDPEDLMIGKDGMIFVATTLLEKWFGVEINLDFSSLSFNVRGPVPLPVEDRKRRKEREKYMPGAAQVARLPLRDMPYSAFTPPHFDVALGASTSRANAGAARQDAAQWSVIGSGDLAGFSSRTFIGGNRNDVLSAVRQTFKRENADGWGAGSFRARAFSFGDVYTPDLPILGGGTQEQGVTLSSRRAGESTTLDRIDVRGDVQPGWDVELFNNDSLIGFQEAGNDGRYNFESVFLTAGENALRLVFYGPQGEIREEKRSVLAGGLENGGGAWDLSVSRAGATTYDANKTALPTDGDMQMTARFEKSLGAGTQASAGYMRRSITDAVIGVRKDYIQGGLAGAARGMLLTANAAYDMDGALNVEALARRNFGPHGAGLSLARSFGDFERDAPGNYAPLMDARLFVRGPLSEEFLGFSNLVYTADTGYTVPSDNAGATAVVTEESLRSSASVSGRAGNVSLNSGLAYNHSAPAGAAAMSGFTSANGFLGRGRWRLSSNYDVQPMEMASYAGTYTYPFSDSLGGTADVTYNAIDATTAMRLSADWRNDDYAISPYVRSATGGQFAAGVNLHFGLVRNPYGDGYEMSSRMLAESGGAAARVFLDVNGDGIYNDGEELLPEVQLQSRQSSRTAFTNEKGVAFIPDIPSGNRTDVAIEPTTLPDPYYVTMEEGASIYPRPGVTAAFEVPVVVSGEMDGKAQYAGPDGAMRPARGARIRIIAPGGRIEKTATAAYDGYWSMSGIKPGVYYLTATQDDPALPGFMMPEMMEFAATGTNAFGKTVTFGEGPGTGFSFSAANAAPGGRKARARVPKTDDIAAREVVLEIGAFRSRLSLVIAWFKLMLDNDTGAGDFSLEKPLAEVEPDPDSGLMHLTLRPEAPLTPEAALPACLRFENAGVNCAIGIVTRWREPAEEGVLTDTLSPRKS